MGLVRLWTLENNLLQFIKSPYFHTVFLILSKLLYIQLRRCYSMRDFHNSPEWNTAKVYLFGDELTEKAAILSPLCVLGTRNESSIKETFTYLKSAYVVHEPTNELANIF